MKTWYHTLGFHHNPFSIKPGAFTYDLQGVDIAEEVNEHIEKGRIVFINGDYGTGKSTLLKSVIDEFGGKGRVCYHSCTQPVDLDRLLKPTMWRRIFNSKKKHMILLLDEVEHLTADDEKRMYSLFSDGYFQGVVLVTNDLEKKFNIPVDKMYTLTGISKQQAKELVRSRIGDLEFIGDDIIDEVHSRTSNPRQFLKFMEEVTRKAVARNGAKVSAIDLKNVFDSSWRDANLVACNEEHEMAYLCKHLGKRQTKKNISVVKEYCKKFKKQKKYSHNREGFYKYLETTNVLEKLE